MEIKNGEAWKRVCMVYHGRAISISAPILVALLNHKALEDVPLEESQRLTSLVKCRNKDTIKSGQSSNSAHFPLDSY